MKKNKNPRLKKVKDLKKLELIVQQRGHSSLGHLRFHRRRFAFTDFRILVEVLTQCDFKKADLRKASFAKVKFFDSTFRKANLSGADFFGTYIVGADFRKAKLRRANFEGAYLNSCDFRGADLRDANFWDAETEGMKTEGAQMPKKAVELPPLGTSFTGWKKVRDGVVLQLEIPADSPRVSGWSSKKCRAKTVKVLTAYAENGGKYTQLKAKGGVFVSLRDSSFTYKVGKVVSVDDFNHDPLIECAEGIHFFVERQLAEEY